MRLTKKTNIENEFNCNYLESEELDLIDEESSGKAFAIFLNKLGQLEDIEEKLGVDLITLYKTSPLQLKALATLTKEELSNGNS